MDVETKSETIPSTQMYSPQRNRSNDQKSTQRVVPEYDTASQIPLDAINSPLHAPQQVINASRQDHIQAQKMIYYMEAAYNRVLGTFRENVDLLLAGAREIDDGMLKLNILIDNTFIQFQAAEKNFPKSLRTEFTRICELMKHDLYEYSKLVPEAYQNGFMQSFIRLEHVLDRKKVEMTKTPEVNSLDPKVLMGYFQVMQQRYCQQDRDMADIEEKTEKVKMPELNSKQRHNNEEFDTK